MQAGRVHAPCFTLSPGIECRRVGVVRTKHLISGNCCAATRKQNAHDGTRCRSNSDGAIGIVARQLVGLLGPASCIGAQAVERISSAFERRAEALTQFIKLIAGFAGGIAQGVLRFLEQRLEFVGRLGFQCLRCDDWGFGGHLEIRGALTPTTPQARAPPVRTLHGTSIRRKINKAVVTVSSYGAVNPALVRTAASVVSFQCSRENSLWVVT